MVDYGWVRETEGGMGKKGSEGGRERERERQERGGRKGGIMKEGKRRSLLSQ